MHQTLAACLIASLFLVACGGVAQPSRDDAAAPDAHADASAEGSPPPDVVSDAGVVDAADAQPDAAADARAQDDVCDVSPSTQSLCYGTPVTDAGTSHTTACDAGLDGCVLFEDDAGANPAVWCCAY